ncbi:MAG: SRPBCC family protein [Gemmatimonadota bacterium]
MEEFDSDEFDSPVASVHRGAGIRIEKTVIINRSAHELFTFWREFENLPRFMTHLDSVKIIDARRSHWVVKGPAGLHYEWEAEIHNEKPDELIAWRSTYGEINHAGSVRFKSLPEGAGTEVIVELRYEPPAGKLGELFAKLAGEEPVQQVEEDLNRFKEVMESPGTLPPADSPSV